MTNLDKRVTGQGRNEKIPDEGITRLEMELPRGVVNRLEILGEAYGGDVAQVISEAVMRLWEAHYAPLPEAPARELAVDDAVEADTVASPVAIPDRRQRVVDLHGQGIPVVDIAREVDWPEENVKRIVGIEAPPPDRELLRDRARTMREIGMSLAAIARQWNEEGVPTFSGQGRWHHTVIKKLVAP